MDLEKLLSIQEKCMNDNPPSCNTECPIHVDVKGFIKEIGKGNFEEAYRILKKRMPFTNILGLVCEHPCEGFCTINVDGKAVSIHELEKAAILYGKEAKIKKLPMPKVYKNIAVIGGGVSGITCASDLSQKGYDVVIFEKEAKAGGSFLKAAEKLTEPKEIQDEIKKLEDLGVEIILDYEVTEEKLKKIIEDYEAVYIGAGAWENRFKVDGVTLQTDVEKIFIGGKLIGAESIVQSVSTGRIAAVSIDRFVQRKSLTAIRGKEGVYKSILQVDAGDNNNILPRVEPVNINYTKEEAIKEAERCIQCECKKCVKACYHLQKEKMDQKAYIRKINQNERIVLGDHYANKTINSCLECGLCGTVCPAGINLANIIKETRQSMVSREKMPISAHDFALKDMEYSNSEYFELVKHEPGKNTSKYVFYPGCQLSASHSEQVIKTYDYLMENLDGGVGLYLGCCGAPADWGGREELFNNSIEKIRSNIKMLGNPIIITACSTCFRNFKDSLKDMEIKSLWEIYDEKGLPSDVVLGEGKVLAVHDACTTRGEKNIHESIRNIAERLNYTIEEPNYTREKTKCCGYGGLVYFSDKEFSKEVTEDRIKNSKADYLTYCANCRDLFILKGKRAYHILDLIYGKNKAETLEMKVPTLSQRRANRFNLKKKILRDLWSEEMKINYEYENLKVIIDDKLRHKMDDELILESDIKKVIGNAEKNHTSFFNPENGHILAWRRLVNVTFWVEYEKSEDAFTIINAYSHRMSVTGV